jgi:ring-1,2-phenylacetyl-CoA epoxidase subunit PaaD
MVVEKPTLETIWRWLDDVPDPEIPVISLTDLGIIRDVQWQDGTLEVTVTPTYSGCPATRIINLDIETALRGHGIEKLVLKRQLSPAWTSDWMNMVSRRRSQQVGPSTAPAVNPHMWKKLANSDRRPARRNGAAPTAWNPSIILSVSDP